MICQSYQRDRLGDRPWPTIEAGVEAHRFGDCQLGVDAAALQHDPDPLAVAATAVLGVHVEDMDLAARTSPVAFQDLDRRRLARAVRPEQGEDLALTHLETQPIDSAERSVLHAEIAHRNRGHTGLPGLRT